MPKITLTTMVMIQNPATGEVLVQDRLRRWKGLAFPGGHVEPGESVYDCAVREVKEETELDVRNLKSCGMLHYSWHDTPESQENRYFVFLFKTNEYAGEVALLALLQLLHGHPEMPPFGYLREVPSIFWGAQRGFQA